MNWPNALCMLAKKLSNAPDRHGTVLQVMDKTAAAGWPGIKISELGEMDDSGAATTPGARPSPAASAAADEEMLVRRYIKGTCRDDEIISNLALRRPLPPLTNIKL